MSEMRAFCGKPADAADHGRSGGKAPGGAAVG